LNREFVDGGNHGGWGWTWIVTAGDNRSRPEKLRGFALRRSSTLDCGRCAKSVFPPFDFHLSLLVMNPMNRRQFLLRSSLLTAAGFLVRTGRAESAPTTPSAAAAVPRVPTAPPAFTEFRALRGNVGIFTGRGGTIGWLAAKDGLAVVDTQFPDTAAMCLAGLPGLAGRTIDVVLNTHHHADHTSGNPVFKAASRTIVAHANVPKLQFAAAERAESSPNASSWARLDRQVYADTTFTKVWRREVGREVIGAQYFGAAHTNGDAVIIFERANVVHVGDLVFNRMYPVIDPLAGASVRGWITVLEEAMKTYPADAIYVFGHGNPKFGVTGGRDDLGVMRDYWSALLAHVEKEIAAGKKKEEVVRLLNLPGFPDFHTPTQNPRLNAGLAAAYDELTGGKA
jgi:cyclase